MPFDVDTARLVRQYLEYGKAWEVYFKFVVPAVDVVERFWKSVAGDAFSFCVWSYSIFSLEMLTLSYTIQSLLF